MADLLIPLGVVAALVALNGLFVAAEFAIVAAPRTAIEQRAARGHRIAKRLAATIADGTRQGLFIATAQLGITLASLGLGMYGEHALASWLAPRLELLGTDPWIAAHSLASVVSIGFLTYLHIVVGEMIPKSVALQHPTQMAFLIARPVFLMSTLLHPLVVAVNSTGTWLLRRVGIDRRRGSEDRYYTPEELHDVVKESETRGLLQPESGQMVRELLDFGDLTAREVMVPRVRITGIEVGLDAQGIRRLLQTSPHTRYPVHTGNLDHIVGVAHIKDLVQIVREGRAVGVEDVRPMPVLPETATLDAVLETLRREHTQMAAVLDEHGGTAGLVTVSDLFDEIVGEIGEGALAEPPSIRRDDRGVLHVAGTVRVEEVGEELGFPLEHPEVDSVSGLVLARLGRLPSVGDEVVYQGVRFTVEAMQGNGVRTAAVVREGASDAG